MEFSAGGSTEPGDRNFLIKEVSEREIGLLVVSHSEPLLERLCSRIINLWEEG